MGERRANHYRGGRREWLEAKRRMRRRRRNIQIAVRLAAMVLAVGFVIFAAGKIAGRLVGGDGGEIHAGNLFAASRLAKSEPVKIIETPPEYDVQLLTVNEYSRPGTAIDKITGIVVHYTANPGTTAQQNRNYFEGLKDSHDTSVSSHFVIGMEGELIQCIPCNEISYASNDRNHDTISIECCIPDETGKFTDETYATLVHLVAWLQGRYGLEAEDIIRHYDVTGKICPKYYVENPDAWDQFISDTQQYIEDYGVYPQEGT